MYLALKILLVDDDVCSQDSVAVFLEMAGHEVIKCQTAVEALETLKKKPVGLIISDIKMPGMSGVELLRKIMRSTVTPPFVVLITGYASVESAIETLKMGAHDYLLKPISADKLMKIIKEIENHPGYQLKFANCSSSSIDDEVSGRVKIHAFCREYADTVKQALAYHEQRSIPVVIEGETGTGKELIARLIHHGRDRDERPFIDINCAAIPANLFESDLFGYEPGAFTGGLARGGRGKVDLAEGGSLFLDEIAEIPIELQPKLLRFLQDKEFYRVSGTRKIKSDIRVICATNRNLEAAVADGTFRADLYYRLNVGKIIIPPLRSCREQILPLAETFMRECAAKNRKAFRRIQVEASKMLIRYDWPGNIRELKNLIEWIVSMHDDLEIRCEHLSPIHLEKDLENLPGSGSRVSMLSEARMRDALKTTGGNKTAAAELLGVSRRTLYRYLSRGITAESK